jgi:hypothetical protein
MGFLSQVGAGRLNGISGHIRSPAEAAGNGFFSHLAFPALFS